VPSDRSRTLWLVGALRYLWPLIRSYGSLAFSMPVDKTFYITLRMRRTCSQSSRWDSVVGLQWSETVAQHHMSTKWPQVATFPRPSLSDVLSSESVDYLTANTFRQNRTRYLDGFRSPRPCPSHSVLSIHLKRLLTNPWRFQLPERLQLFLSEAQPSTSCYNVCTHPVWIIRGACTSRPYRTDRGNDNRSASRFRHSVSRIWLRRHR
jgi:hypothetical protein